MSQSNGLQTEGSKEKSSEEAKESVKMEIEEPEKEDAKETEKMEVPEENVEIKESEVEEVKKSGKTETGASSGERSHWWRDFFKDEEMRAHQKAQAKLWEDELSLLSPGQLKSGSVFGLVVRDPRVILPNKRGGIQEEDDGEGFLTVKCGSISFNLFFSSCDSERPSHARFDSVHREQRPLVP